MLETVVAKVADQEMKRLMTAQILHARNALQDLRAMEYLAQLARLDLILQLMAKGFAPSQVQDIKLTLITLAKRSAQLELQATESLAQIARLGRLLLQQALGSAALLEQDIEPTTIDRAK